MTNVLAYCWVENEGVEHFIEQHRSSKIMNNNINLPFPYLLHLMSNCMLIKIRTETLQERQGCGIEDQEVTFLEMAEIISD